MTPDMQEALAQAWREGAIHGFAQSNDCGYNGEIAEMDHRYIKQGKSPYASGYRPEFVYNSAGEFAYTEVCENNPYENTHKENN